MNFSELIPLTAALTNLALTVFVVIRDPRSKVSRVYALWGGAITVWNFGTFMMFRVSNPEQALFWAQFLQFGVIFLPISLLHLCLLLAQIPTPRFMRFLYLFHAILAVSNFSDFFVEGVRRVIYSPGNSAFYTVGGAGFWFFTAVYSIETMTTLVMLYQKQKSLPPLRRTRLRSLLWANGILILFGVNDLLPILRFDYYPLTKSIFGTGINIFPFGSAAAIVYGIIIGYSVLQHHLLDIHVTLSQVAAHIVRLIFLFLIGMSLLLILNVVAPKQFTPFSIVSELGILLVSAMVASIFFPRLFGSGEDQLERRILGDKFEYHDKIKSFTRLIPTYTDKPMLLDDLHDLLVKTIQVSRYQIIFLDEKTRVFSVIRNHPSTPGDHGPELTYDSPIFDFCKSSRVEFLAANTLYTAPSANPAEREARRQLALFRAEFCFPFYSDDDPFGLMLVGAKHSGDPYTRHDLRLLADLIKNLSLVLNQIRLKDQILVAQELELLGRMSRGMAHDLNNLLTPVWTYLQLSNAGLDSAETREELLPMAMRNLQAMRAYVNEALFFSDSLAPHFSQARMRDTVEHAISLAESEWKRKNITVSLDAPEEILAEVDDVLIQRVIKNLLSNAVDASPEGGRIEVSLTRLARTEATRDWLRLRVVDHGQGIRSEHLKRVFQPYFTTKDRGDQERGFGLGLAICRKIVNLHGGSLSLSSEYKKGTVVQVDLPDRHPTAAVDTVALAS